MTSDAIIGMPPAPARAFASDNAAGALPEVLDALVAANDGHALAYGADRWTAEAESRFRDLFGPRSQAYLVWNGTGANVMALATLTRPGDAVVCSEWAHIHVDETAAPERVAGVKLLPQPSLDAKLQPAQVEELAHLIGNQHHAQPTVLSLTQSTELGAVYTAAEVAALCDAAHRLGMVVHMDGARIANATAALGGDVAALRSFTVDAGVDVVSFGGTKAGLAFGEAVVFLDAALADAGDVRPQAGQPVVLEDALRRRPVQRPAARRPVDPRRRARQRDDPAAVPVDRRAADGGLRRRPGGQQPVPRAAPGGDRAAARAGASSGTGTSPRTRCAG